MRVRFVSSGQQGLQLAGDVDRGVLAVASDDPAGALVPAIRDGLAQVQDEAKQVVAAALAG